MWKFCRNPAESVFPKNFHTRKLGEITVFYAAVDIDVYVKIQF